MYVLNLCCVDTRSYQDLQGDYSIFNEIFTTLLEETGNEELYLL